MAAAYDPASTHTSRLALILASLCGAAFRRGPVKRSSPRRPASPGDESWRRDDRRTLAEVGDDGKDAAILVGALFQSHFGKDVPDVALHRIWAQEELLADRAI